MKASLDLFMKLLIELIDIDKFYSIEVNKYQVKLQASYESDLVKEFTEKGFEFEIIAYGYVKGKTNASKIFPNENFALYEDIDIIITLI